MNLLGFLDRVPCRGPFLERPGNFSGPKSHFKNHEAFYVQNVFCQQVLHLSKAYTYAAFRIFESFWFFCYGLLKLAFRGFRETAPWTLETESVTNIFTTVRQVKLLQFYLDENRNLQVGRNM